LYIIYIYHIPLYSCLTLFSENRTAKQQEDPTKQILVLLRGTTTRDILLTKLTALWVFVKMTTYLAKSHRFIPSCLYFAAIFSTHLNVCNTICWKHNASPVQTKQKRPISRKFCQTRKEYGNVVWKLQIPRWAILSIVQCLSRLKLAIIYLTRAFNNSIEKSCLLLQGHISC